MQSTGAVARAHNFVDVSRCIPDADANVDVSVASAAAAARFPAPVEFDDYSRYRTDAPAVKFGERIEEETRTVRQNLRLLRALIDDPSAPLSPWSYDVLHFFDAKGGARGGFPPLGTNLCCYPLAQLASEWVDVGLSDPTLVVVGRQVRCPDGCEWVRDEDALLSMDGSDSGYPACSHPLEPPCDEEWDCDDDALGEARGAAPPTFAAGGGTLVFSVCTDEELDAFGEGGGAGEDESFCDAGDSDSGAANAASAPEPAHLRGFSFPPKTTLLSPDGPPAYFGEKKTWGFPTKVSVFPTTYARAVNGLRTSTPHTTPASSPGSRASEATRRQRTTLTDSAPLQKVSPALRLVVSSATIRASSTAAAPVNSADKC